MDANENMTLLDIVFVVDMKERTARDIWKIPEQGEKNSRLNIASKPEQGHERREKSESGRERRERDKKEDQKRMKRVKRAHGQNGRFIYRMGRQKGAGGASRLQSFRVGGWARSAGRSHRY